jgi:hypothetical protein
VSTTSGAGSRPGHAAVSPSGSWPEVPAASQREHYGWLLFAGVLLAIAGPLNIIYGIAAISNSSFFAHNTHYIFSNLNTWGWVTLVFGVLQIAAAVSLWRGGLYGRLFGIAVAAFGSLAAMLSIPARPFWSLAIFTLDLLIIYGLASYRRTD